MEVAVKMLKPQSTEEGKVKFLQEAAIMGQFLHPHVVKLHGVVTMGEPVKDCLGFLFYLCTYGEIKMNFILVMTELVFE